MPDRRDCLLITAGITDRLQVVEQSVQHGEISVTSLDQESLLLAMQLMPELEEGFIRQTGDLRPPSLAAFSDSILSAIPDLFGFKFVHLISSQTIPLELVTHGGAFLGDIASVSHAFLPTKGDAFAAKRFKMKRYVIEATIAMPQGMKRSEQDIVKVALSLDDKIGVELHSPHDKSTLMNTLVRDDVSILHIDTHGGEDGRSIQVTRSGKFMAADDLPEVCVPVVLLVGCEGVRDRCSFGSCLLQRGAEAVISSYAKFASFGITGDTKQEQNIYIAFFNALLAGEDIGSALLQVRRAAVIAGAETLTRFFFVLLGNSQVRFQFDSD